MDKRYRNLTLIVAGLLLLVGMNAVATEVWSGPTKIFTKADWADWTDEGSQDRITANVWLTRADYEGMFNIAQEEYFDYYYGESPLDTEWAMGNAEDYAELDFYTWVDWHGWCPPCVLEMDAVLHLISDDIYIDIVVLDWTEGGYGKPGTGQGGLEGSDQAGPPGEGGGGFTYIRAISPVSPAAGSTFSVVKSLY